MNRKSQKQKILEWMQSGRFVGPATAMNKWNCYRLAARIKELRNDGHKIKTTINKSSRVKYATYTIEKGDTDVQS